MTNFHMLRSSRAKVAGLALALLAAPLPAETIAITGGTVAIGDGSQPIRGGTVVIANGKVVAAGASVAVPAGAKVVDATGKWVSPGIVAGVSTLGLMEGYGMSETNDLGPTSRPSRPRSTCRPRSTRPASGSAWNARPGSPAPS